MRFPTAYYLMLIYFAALFKPVMPWVCDFLAHTFNEFEHISIVHHENGKDHVHLDIRKAASENGNNGPCTLKLSNEVSVHILVNKIFILAVDVLLESRYFTGLTCKIPFIFSHVQLQPPRSGLTYKTHNRSLADLN